MTLGGNGSRGQDTLGGKEPELVEVPASSSGWVEQKKTGGKAMYWYQRWRETLGGKVVKKSHYLSPVKRTLGKPTVQGLGGNDEHLTEIK